MFENIYLKNIGFGVKLWHEDNFFLVDFSFFPWDNDTSFLRTECKSANFDVAALQLKDMLSNIGSKEKKLIKLGFTQKAFCRRTDHLN